MEIHKEIQTATEFPVLPLPKLEMKPQHVVKLKSRDWNNNPWQHSGDYHPPDTLAKDVPPPTSFPVFKASSNIPKPPTPPNFAIKLQRIIKLKPRDWGNNPWRNPFGEGSGIIDTYQPPPQLLKKIEGAPSFTIYCGADKVSKAPSPLLVAKKSKMIKLKTREWDQIRNTPVENLLLKSKPQQAENTFHIYLQPVDQINAPPAPKPPKVVMQPISKIMKLKTRDWVANPWRNAEYVDHEDKYQPPTRFLTKVLETAAWFFGYLYRLVWDIPSPPPVPKLVKKLVRSIALKTRDWYQDPWKNPVSGVSGENEYYPPLALVYKPVTIPGAIYAYVQPQEQEGGREISEESYHPPDELLHRKVKKSNSYPLYTKPTANVPAV
jgi:hypothetical protein